MKCSHPRRAKAQSRLRDRLESKLCASLTDEYLKPMLLDPQHIKKLTEKQQSIVCMIQLINVLSDLPEPFNRTFSQCVLLQAPIVADATKGARAASDGPS